MSLSHWIDNKCLPNQNAVTIEVTKTLKALHGEFLLNIKWWIPPRNSWNGQFLVMRVSRNFWSWELVECQKMYFGIHSWNLAKNYIRLNFLANAKTDFMSSLYIVGCRGVLQVGGLVLGSPWSTEVKLFNWYSPSK